MTGSDPKAEGPVPKAQKELEGLPFPAQIVAIDEAVEGARGLPRLLGALAGFPDHEPLAHAVRALAQRGALVSDAEVRAVAEALFLTLPDTGLQRVLKGLDRAMVAQESLAVVIEAVVGALEVLGPERIAAVCLMDRWLKNAAPSRRARLRDSALAACEAALGAGRPEGVDDAVLLRVPGDRFEALGALAEAQGCGVGWRARLDAFASRVLETLQGRPRSLSLANAEEILSRRVYTDPGHFLVELLQNAEDSGAGIFRVHVAEGEVAVWHDGAPFDAKDVVGVLSIGQTTKARDQIGFFGVGFKAVYEVCERPQIYSALFNFEIADISIPRPLNPQPVRRGEGTLLVLPYRASVGEDRSPARLTKKAMAVPPETLMTLSNLATLEVVGAGGERRTISRRAVSEGRIDLVHEEAGTRSGYLVASRRFEYEGARRELSKATQTRALVAVSLDSEGNPTPILSPEAPTIFSHLPTGERSGLRFMVHAHFDLPVDRERLNLESPWNRWALSCAGLLLAEVVERLCADQASAEARLPALLDVLPLPDELSHLAYRGLLDALVEACSGLAMLRAADGSFIAPPAARLVSGSDLIEALAGVGLDDEGRLALSALSPRRARVAEVLGARPYSPADLWALIERSMADTTSGEPWPAAWLEAGAPVFMDVIGAHQAEIEASLRGELAWLPDHLGRPQSAGGLARGPQVLRGLYGDTRAFLAADLDHRPTPGQAALLEHLDLERLGAEDLIADLALPSISSRIFAGAGPSALHGYLATLATDTVRHLGTLPLFPDTAGDPRPLAQGLAGRAWIAPAGALGDFMEAVESRPPILDRAFSGRFATYLGDLGAVVLGLEAMVGLCDSGEVVLSGEEVEALHRCLDQMASELTLRQFSALASAPLFPDRAGVLRPMSGAGRALMPAFEAVVAVSPEAPWVDGGLLGMRHMVRLPVETIGHAQIIDAMIGGSLPELVDIEDVGCLRRVYRFLIHGSADLLPKEIRRLESAAVWRDESGVLATLGDLHLSAGDPELGMLFGALGTWPCVEIEGEPSAMALVSALGLVGSLTPLDERALIEALGRGEGLEVFAEDEGLQEILARILRGAVGRFGASELAPLRKAPIFEAVDGRRLPPGDWKGERVEAVHRASGVLREALSQGSRPLISERDEVAYGAVLDAVGSAPADVMALVEALESDSEMREEAARAAGRAALAKSVAALSSLQRVVDIRARLTSLEIWPTRRGELVAASEVVLSDALEAALGGAWGAFLDGGEAAAVLSEAAEVEARALGALMHFRSPVDLVMARVRAVARLGEPLERQAPLLSTRERLLDVLRLACAHLDVDEVRRLPVSLDAEGRLVSGGMLAASGAALTLARGLDLWPQVADPVWAQAVDPISPGFLAPLTPARLIQALVRAARGDGHVEALDDAAGRARLWAWLLVESEAIEADDNTLGALGNAPLILTASGERKAPRALLLSPSFEALTRSLGLDGWRCADEVPEALRRWLQRVFHLEQGRLQQLVEVLAEAHREAQSRSDGVRSMAVLGALARALDEGLGDDLRAREAIIKRHKLHRLRVETDEGGFERIAKLMLPTIEQRQLLERFLPEPPLCVSDRYDEPDTRAFLRLCGASPDLEPSRLEAMLKRGQGLREGAEAGLALARYIAMAAAERPRISAELKLGESAWVPDGLGSRKAPGALYWPDPDVEALIGVDPGFYPHPEFFHTVPESISTALPFRHADKASLEDVLAHLSGARQPIGATALQWFEAGLRAGRLDTDAVRAAFAARPMLVDESGMARLPVELVCTPGRAWLGDHLGTWGEGLRYSKLSSVLRIPQSVGPQEVLAYGDQLRLEVERQGAEALLDSQPDLTVRLPRCLALLGERGGASHRHMPVLAMDTEGRQGVFLASDPRLALPEPGWLEAAAMAGRLPLCFPVVDPEARDASLGWLRGCGVPSLGDMFVLEPLPRALAGDVTANHAGAVTALQEAMGRLGAVMPAQIREAYPGEVQVRVVADLEVRGALVGQGVSVPRDAVFEAARGRLVVTPEGLEDKAAIAASVVEVFEAMRPEAQKWRVALAEVLEGVEPQALPELSQVREGAKPVSPPKPRGEVIERASAREQAVEEDASGIWSRVKKWWSKDDEEPRETATEAQSPPKPPAPRPPRKRREDDEGSPFGLSDHSQWFRPKASIEPQLRDGQSWAQDRSRRPEYGFAFAPPSLPYPHRYAPQCIAGQFDRRTQRWLPTSMDPAWSRPEAEGSFLVALKGRIARGENLFPTPLYGRLIEVDGEVKTVRARDGRTLLIARAPTEVSCTVALDKAPRFDGIPASPANIEHLLELTVPDEDLPDEALDLVDGLHGEGPGLSSALAIRGFIQNRYRYDPSYIEDPAVARWLEKVSRGRANAHIAALHAGADGRHLGAGVCYELGALACELMRRVGIPAAVATGWTWDRGQIGDPDHLWAMALLPTGQGLRWVPIDPSTTREGRPLHVGHRPRGDWQVKPPGQKAKVPDAPSWGHRPPPRRGAARRQNQAGQRAPSGGGGRRLSHGRSRPPVAELMRVARYLASQRGEPLESPENLQARCKALLDDPDSAVELLGMLDEP